MGSKNRIALVAMLTVAVVVVTYFALTVVSHRRTATKYERGYPQINVGDSRDVVVSLMGQPSRTTNCEYAAFPDRKLEADYRSKCKEQYRYEVLLKDYIISFDKEGKVIGKNSAVSP